MFFFNEKHSTKARLKGGANSSWQMSSLGAAQWRGGTRRSRLRVKNLPCGTGCSHPTVKPEKSVDSPLGIGQKVEDFPPGRLSSQGAKGIVGELLPTEVRDKVWCFPPGL